jgi:hypothetical protein
LENAPGLEQWLRRKMGSETAEIYMRPKPASGPTIRFKPHFGSIQTTRPCELLNYQPAVTRAQALELTLKWARHARIMES